MHLSLQKGQCNRQSIKVSGNLIFQEEESSVLCLFNLFQRDFKKVCRVKFVPYMFTYEESDFK